LRGVFPHAEPTSALIDELGVLALTGAGSRESQQAVRQRLSDLEGQAESLEDQRQQVQLSLDDEILDHAATSEDARNLRATVAELRQRLMELGRHEEAWTFAAPPSPPENFSQLLARLPELARIVFTGDKEVTLSLDEQDPIGTWAGKSWDALVALDGYANRRLSGKVGGAVHDYLKETPPGAPGYSAARHAYDESTDVKQNPKFSAKRLLPVPLVVDESGYMFMGAHFKVAQSGLVSPRLHYHDDVHRTGKIYVGHLGPHLPTKRTN
jgi:hypothetical protein